MTGNAPTVIEILQEQARALQRLIKEAQRIHREITDHLDRLRHKRILGTDQPGTRNVSVSSSSSALAAWACRTRLRERDRFLLGIGVPSRRVKNA